MRRSMRQDRLLRYLPQHQAHLRLHLLPWPAPSDVDSSPPQLTKPPHASRTLTALATGLFKASRTVRVAAGTSGHGVLTSTGHARKSCSSSALDSTRTRSCRALRTTMAGRRPHSSTQHGKSWRTKSDVNWERGRPWISFSGVRYVPCMAKNIQRNMTTMRLGCSSRKETPV